MTKIHRSARSRLVVTALGILVAGITPVLHAQNTTITIQASQPGKAISPDLFGVFFEDLNYAADGGLYAELIQNRSFEYSPVEQPDWSPLKFWELQKRGGGEGSIGVADMRPIHQNNPHYALLTVTRPGDGVGIANSGDTCLSTTLSPSSKPPTLAASAVRDSKSGDTIIKIVNGANASAALNVKLDGLAAGQLQATKTVLAGPDADAFNEDGQPPAVKPVSSDATLKPTFDYEAPANSLKVFRIRK